MANIDRIVNVQIALNTTGISKEGFSTLLIVGPHVHSLSRVETYTGVDGMTEAGFSVTDPLYLAAAAAFSQTPRPTYVKIGRRQCDSVVAAVKTVSAAGTYTVTVKTKDSSGNVTSVPYAYSNSNGAAKDILAGIASLIVADTNAAVTATATDTELTITSKDTTKAFMLTVSSNMTAAAGAVSESIADTMTAVCASDNDWYGFAITSREQADIMAAAAWAETQAKLFGVAIAEAGAKDADVTTDTGSQLVAKNYYRTFWFYHALAKSEYPECALMARCFAVDPGGETWANKKLAGVTTDGLTETEYNAVTKKNGNTFEKFRNVSITQNGKVAGDEWIDVIRFRDWLQEEIRVNVFSLMINSDKVPYTDAGIAAIEAQIRSALELGQTRGGIAPTEYDEDGNENLGFTISVPLASDVSANTKALRTLTDVSFTARLAGAIHVVTIKGSLTYSNLISTTY